MKKIIFMLLFMPCWCMAQIKWQVAEEGIRPYYFNYEDSQFVCDSTSNIAPANTYYCIYIKYIFNDATNHPVYSCGHNGSYSFRRKSYEKDGKYDLDWQCEEFGANYCDVCNNKIQVYYYPKESLIFDLMN